MKLLTHNMMQSHVKGITKRFPLLIKPADDGVRIVEQVKHDMLYCIGYTNQFEFLLLTIFQGI